MNFPVFFFGSQFGIDSYAAISAQTNREFLVRVGFCFFWIAAAAYCERSKSSIERRMGR